MSDRTRQALTNAAKESNAISLTDPEKQGDKNRGKQVENYSEITFNYQLDLFSDGGRSCPVAM